MLDHLLGADKWRVKTTYLEINRTGWKDNTMGLNLLPFSSKRHINQPFRVQQLWEWCHKVWRMVLPVQPEKLLRRIHSGVQSSHCLHTAKRKMVQSKQRCVPVPLDFLSMCRGWIHYKRSCLIRSHVIIVKNGQQSSVFKVRPTPLHTSPLSSLTRRSIRTKGKRQQHGSNDFFYCFAIKMQLF